MSALDAWVRSAPSASEMMARADAVHVIRTPSLLLQRICETQADQVGKVVVSLKVRDE